MQAALGGSRGAGVTGPLSMLSWSLDGMEL